MAATRKLRERLGMVVGNDVPTEPELKVPTADKAGALVEAAESGFAAIQALYADRNKSVELAQTLHRETVYLRNVNNSLRADLVHCRQERDYYLQLSSRISAWVIQAHDLLGRIASDIGHVTTVIEHMEPPAPVTNNPEAPPLNALGLPIVEPVIPLASFDSQGLQISAPPPIDPAELQHLINGGTQYKPQ